jgi:hypothetical protein
MKLAYAFAAIGISLMPAVACAQNVNCNVLARDLVVKNFDSSWSDYSKLLFLSSLTQMDVKTSGEALTHSGQVSVGPIKIGPGDWSKQKQDELRTSLQKIVNIEQLRESAASVSIYSGDPNTAKVVSDCLRSGGFYVTLNDLGTDYAVAELMWTNYPGGKIEAVIADVTVVNGKVYGSTKWATEGATLAEKLSQQITIQRDDPKKDVAIIVNTSNAGSSRGYLPPSVLPPPPPPKIVREVIEGTKVTVGTGGRYEGGRNPCPGANRQQQSCVRPQHGGIIVEKSGKPKIYSSNGRTNTQNETESPQEYCVFFHSATGACEAEDVITGAASAVEEYAVSQ